jgi:uncharacterized DUF497 family protein
VVKSNIEQVKTANALVEIIPNELSKKRYSFSALKYLILSILVAAWLPDGIMLILNSITEKLKISQMLLGIFVVIISILIIFGSYKKMKSIVLSRKIEVVREEAIKSKVLILFLSSIRNEDETRKIIDGNVELDKLMVELENNQWKMPLIAINHHLPKLEKVIVLTSKAKSTPGSDSNFKLFNDMINKFYKDRKIKVIPKKGLDFEDVKAVFEQIDDIYLELKKEQIKDRDVILDVTGGQKPNSVAGALATYVYDRKFQYISTNSKEVYSYDMVPVKEDY